MKNCSVAATYTPGWCPDSLAVRGEGAITRCDGQYRVGDSLNQQPYQNPDDIQPFIEGLLLAGFRR